MGKFEYHARDLSGTPSRGVIEGNSISEAYQALIRQGLIPIHIAERNAPLREKKIEATVDRRLRLRKRLQVKFVRRLADLLHAGIPLDRSLEILERASLSRNFSLIALQLKLHVQGGGGLADAIDSLDIGFPRFAGAMIRAGESAGDLEGALYSLADVVERDDEMQRNIVSSLYYPCMVFSVSVIGIILMMVLVVPLFGPLTDLDT